MNDERTVTLSKIHRNKENIHHTRRVRTTKRNHKSKHTLRKNKQSKLAKESNNQLNYALKQIRITPAKTKRAVKYNRQVRNTKRGINDAINMRLTKRLKNNRQYKNGYMKVIKYWNKDDKLWNNNKGAYKDMIKYETLAPAGNA